jgi:hypothetical protein
VSFVGDFITVIGNKVFDVFAPMFKKVFDVFDVLRP